MTEIAHARLSLRAGAPSSRAIHEARRSLKRARALLRLGRGTPLEKTCLRADCACRHAARALAPARDASVFAATLNEILERGGEDLPARERSAGRGLADRARREASRALTSGVPLRRADAALRACPRRLGSGVFRRDVDASLKEGLRRSYKHSRRAYRAALSTPAEDAFHSLRKATKRLLYELEWLKPRGSKMLDELRRFSGLLGDEHDLSMLLRRLTRSAASGASREIHRLARRRQLRLRKRAMRIGSRVFSVKPRTILRRIPCRL